MYLPNGSASAAERVIACPASLVLARVETETRYSARGRDMHGYTRQALTGTPLETALGTVAAEHRDTCRNIDWQDLVGDLSAIECEPAFAIDVKARTARRLGHNVNRDYHAAALRYGGPLGPHEVPGSGDIIGRSTVTGRLTVMDMKFGYQDVTPVAENGQGLFFASVLYLLTGEPAIDVRLTKIKPSGKVWHDKATHTAWEMDAFLDDYEAALERAAAMRVALPMVPTVHEDAEGGHCTYCPAFNTCPAKTALARAMVETLAPYDVERGIADLSQEAAGRAQVIHDRAKAILTRVGNALHDRALGAPFPLPDGETEMRAAPYERESLVQGTLLALARTLGATDEQIEACYRTIQVEPVKACKIRGVAKVRGKKGRAA